MGKSNDNNSETSNEVDTHDNNNEWKVSTSYVKIIHVLLIIFYITRKLMANIKW